MSSGSGNAYQGDVTASEAYRLIQSEPKAQIVDVRTKAEWSFVGVPDVSAAGKDVILAEWQRYPAMDVSADFVDVVEKELLRRGAGRDDPVLFLCRSGARSLSAAKAMMAAGWHASRNISGGFEGPPDADRHRGAIDGWKASGLPWVQS
jgi:rhodanese-related sulfurtransferase